MAAVTQMSLAKSRDFFNPEIVKGRIHIVGCGSVGSTIAENLARCGVSKFTLWDFDIVEAHNIVNQMFVTQQIGMNKAEATKDIIMSINPSADVVIQNNGWSGRLMSGYIFLCVDNIDLRREIVEKHMGSMAVKAVFDIRTELTGAQHYAADWKDREQKDNILRTMQFSHEEAAADTPTSACGVTLGIATTVRLVCAMAVNNFTRFVKGEGIWKMVMVDGFTPSIDAY